jgi:Putative DNA-binding domain
MSSNDTAGGLANALAKQFPVVRRLAGVELFTTMAEAYVVAEPARSPVTLRFLDGFPTFVDRYDPARPIPYLGDIARLETARFLARGAAAAVSLGPDSFAALGSDRLGDRRVSLHPSLAVVASLHPIYSIWHMNRDPVRFTPVSPWVSEAVLVARPGRHVRTRCITHGDAAFIFALMAGYRLADAMAAAAHAVPRFHPADSLARLIGAKGIIGLGDDGAAAPITAMAPPVDGGWTAH